MQKRVYCLAFSLLCGGLSACAWAQVPAPPARRLPVREVTIFKDGHAFVLHAGSLPTDAQGHVPMDYLPTPVLGTFWPYSGDPNVRLTGVTASVQKTTESRPAQSVRELIEANPGAKVSLTQPIGTPPYARRLDAEIVEVLKRPLEPATTARANAPTAHTAGYTPAPQSDTALLKTKTGVLAVPIDQIQTITFHGAYRRAVSQETYRNRMTLQLEWPGGRPEKTAKVGMVYLQKGLRWVPNYRIRLDGSGQARVLLQATLINELVDLENVTAHLVIGVPSFAFKDLPDAISLQQSFPELSRYFQPDAQTGYAFSNAIMSQAVGGRMGERAGGGSGGPANIPDEIGAGRNEDLFLFTVRGISLKRGQSMALPIKEFAIPYRDVYTLEIAPQGLARADNLPPEQQREMARLLRAPRVQHRLRLTNQSPYPLTTAPALVVSGEKVVAQAMLTYTAVGGEADLPLTTAGEIRASRNEREAGRTASAMKWHDYQFDRVDMSGELKLTNFGPETVELEIARIVPGYADQVTADGSVTLISLEDAPLALFEDQRYHMQTGVNGIARFFWKKKLAPGEDLTLPYAWHYFTR